MTEAEVVIAGIGQTPVGEHWDRSLRSLAAQAIQAARQDASGLAPQAMYIGSFLASTASHQSNLGALLAQHVGLEGIEGITVEAAEASGAAAFTWATWRLLPGWSMSPWWSGSRNIPMWSDRKSMHWLPRARIMIMKRSTA